MLGSADSEKVRLISREIIFAEFQPRLVSYMMTITQRYRRMDRRTTCLGAAGGNRNFRAAST